MTPFHQFPATHGHAAPECTTHLAWVQRIFAGVGRRVSQRVEILMVSRPKKPNFNDVRPGRGFGLTIISAIEDRASDPRDGSLSQFGGGMS